ncbi:UNVERIFIED_CONTAM: hypothetical protein N8J90_18885 [Halobacillus marinus]|uniref:hypothetical protein n=1 Tax=Halobacillus sp. BAB-2008 TaxID=1246484 RepID=UPI0002A4D41D|nr:hypothetical protein [Halobacillus sp. BAB-2008]ELK46798.1 hypothetical protein D479_09025 [Halobacillus sp. BAB-2008]
MGLALSKVNKKMAVLGVLLVSVMWGSAAFALPSTSTANLNGTGSANGGNINIWDDYADVSGYVTLGDISARVKKSVTLLPDPTEWSRLIYSGNFSYDNVYIPDASTYYAQASRANARGTASGQVKVVSLD